MQKEKPYPASLMYAAGKRHNKRRDGWEYIIRIFVWHVIDLAQEGQPYVAKPGTRLPNVYIVKKYERLKYKGKNQRRGLEIYCVNTRIKVLLDGLREMSRHEWEGKHISKAIVEVWIARRSELSGHYNRPLRALECNCRHDSKAWNIIYTYLPRPKLMSTRN